MYWRKWLMLGSMVFFAVIVVKSTLRYSSFAMPNFFYEFGNIDEDESVPAPVVALPVETDQPNDASALGPYDVLIADRGNNRLIVVTPDKKIIWEYHFNVPAPGYGADDAFFTDGGKQIIVNLENYQLIEIIDYATKQVVWSYGVPGKAGSTEGLLHSPDDAYALANGDVIVADIKNCRVIEINQSKQIVHQYGQTRKCSDAPGFLNYPNGDTPLPNGHVLISNIRSHNLIELDQDWQPVFSMTFPLSYPSDPQMTAAGNILISNYVHPGEILEISKQGRPVWEFTGDNAVKLNRPSLAVELPNGNILANDDYNHRVIVINKKTKKIAWQYGVTGKPGINPGQLNVPDGLDIIKHNAVPTPTPAATIGSVTRHAQNFIGRYVSVRGYMLKKEPGYIIISDEPNGKISAYDLPVTGPGIDSVEGGKEYTFEGIFLDQGLIASNQNPDHLELSQMPLP